MARCLLRCSGKLRCGGGVGVGVEKHKRQREIRWRWSDRGQCYHSWWDFFLSLSWKGPAAHRNRILGLSDSPRNRDSHFPSFSSLTSTIFAPLLGPQKLSHLPSFPPSSSCDKRRGVLPALVFLRRKLRASSRRRKTANSDRRTELKSSSAPYCAYYSSRSCNRRVFNSTVLSESPFVLKS